MNEIKEFISTNAVMCLATTDGEKPRASAMEYVVVDEQIVFATDPNSRKAKNLEVNKNISISIVSMPQFVAIDGIVSQASEKQMDEYNKALFERHPEFKEMVANGEMKPFVYFVIDNMIAYYNDYSQGMQSTQMIEL